MTVDAPNGMWATDFQCDATTEGWPVKIMSIVDEHTREFAGWSNIAVDVHVLLSRRPA
ncbi:hypothetical protein [Nocardia cyriacigeorgica]|uniref:hypothetical protein n=1 Tax=Nocardia cyriacigeorgica TaxID=135487 RepID=UPI001892D3DD|nr:hypothetical protein [Nocardia cyriacigeorgica]